MSILYPVAETAEAALHAPSGQAVRAREAEAIAAAPVLFMTEPVGPAFSTRDAALAAYPGAGEERDWRQLTPVAATPRPPSAPVRPIYRDGHRWPEPAIAEPVLWRLQVSYWRIAGEGGEPAAPADHARKLRRHETGRALKGPALNALARQPLRAMKPQQPLDIGLFEVSRPEAPDALIPDE